MDKHLKQQPETEAIDRLFLELSQFTNATTARELALQKEIAKLHEEIGAARQQALELSWKIEQLPAGGLQTEISIRSSALGTKLNELLPET